MKKFSAWLSIFIGCFLFWELLVWSLDLREILLGVLVAALAAWFTLRFTGHNNSFYMYNPVRLIALVFYSVCIFFVELVKANVSMAGIVFSPNFKNAKPGVIRIPGSDKIRSTWGLAMVSNSITLTPGTITMDVAEDADGKNYYYVQWIDVAETDRDKAGEIIKGKMERGVEKIWK